MAALAGTVWIIEKLDNYWYLDFDLSDPWVTNGFRVFIKAAGTW